MNRTDDIIDFLYSSHILASYEEAAAEIEYLSKHIDLDRYSKDEIKSYEMSEITFDELCKLH